MQPQSTDTVVKALILLQMVAVVTLVAATFAAVVVDIPLYPAMLLLGGVGLMLLVANRQRDRGVLLFGASALVFAAAYYVCLYLLQLPLSPLYLFVLAYALLCLAGGSWLLIRLRRRA